MWIEARRSARGMQGARSGEHASRAGGAPGQVLAQDLRGPLAQDGAPARGQRDREARLHSALRASAHPHHLIVHPDIFDNRSTHYAGRRLTQAGAGMPLHIRT